MLPPMRAVVLRGAGGPEVLSIREVPDPQPGPDDVLVRVRASALNRADLLQRRGLYPAPPGAPPDIPGLEFAGEIRAVGQRVGSLKPGERVMGIVGGGGHAEHVVLPERACLRIPPGLSFEQAAAVPEAFLTAWDALFRAGRLIAGEVVLVQAAASGVGLAALQLAALAGARVLGLSRSGAKRERLAALGPFPVLDPSLPGLADSIRLAAGADGVDLAIDLVGGSAWALHADVLREGGRIVVLGLLGGARADVDLGTLLRKRLTVVGSALRSRRPEEKIALVQEFARTILPLIAAGRVAPVVDSVFDLADVREAHLRMERNENLGKIVLRIER
jgi:putative PIG3 family NAD(P)H quinone oxidoreductase